MRIIIKNLDLLTRDKQIGILRAILENRYINLGWIKQMLSVRQIPGRSRHYLAFQEPYYFNSKHFNVQTMDNTWSLTTEQQTARTTAAEQILDHSDLKWWVGMFMKEVSIEELARTIGYWMNNRLEIEITLSGLQTQ